MPQSRLSRRQENAAATRDGLLETARELFGKRGFAAVGIEEIAARAGVTTGALYHHFGSKRALFRAVFDALEAEQMERSIAVGSGYGDSWQGLEAAIDATLDAGLAPEFRQIALRDARTVLSASEWRTITDRYSFGRLRDAIEGFMESGMIAPASSEMLARALISLIGELSVSVAEAKDTGSARRDAERLVRKILAALRAP